MGMQCGFKVWRDYGGCWAAGIGRREAHHQLIVVPANIAHNTEINNRNDWNFRIGNSAQPGPNLVDRCDWHYHVAFG